MRESNTDRPPSGASVVGRARGLARGELAGGAAVTATVRRQGAASARVYTTGGIFV